MTHRRHLTVGIVFSLLLNFVPVFSQGPDSTPRRPVQAVSRVPAARVQQQLNAQFDHYDVFELNLPAVEQLARSSGQVTLQFNHRIFDLMLEPNNLRAPDFRRVLTTDAGVIEEPWSPVSTYKGHLRDDPESVVRMLILPDLLQGYIRTAEDWIFIDPLLKYEPGVSPSDVIIYREGDVRPEAIGVCGTGELVGVAQKLNLIREEGHAPGPALAQNNLQRAEIATEADFEYSQIFNNPNAQIEGVINSVEGIYENQLDLTFEITFQHVFTTQSQPYTSTNPSALLNQFRNYWNANNGGVNRDLAHLFTGKNLDGGVIGIGFVGVVCNLGSAYAASQDFSLMIKLVAHEIGHNFNALHDDEFNPPAANCNGSGPIMCSFIQNNGPNSFSNQSVSDITAFVNAINCLEDASSPPPPPPPSPPPQPQPPNCAAETAMQDSPNSMSALTTLRQFRDGVLTRSRRGQRYIEFFNSYTDEVSALMLQDFQLLLGTQQAIVNLLPQFQALVVGRQTSLTKGQLERIRELLERVRKQGSPGLAQAVGSILKDLNNPTVLRQFGISVR